MALPLEDISGIVSPTASVELKTPAAAPTILLKMTRYLCGRLAAKRQAAADGDGTPPAFLCAILPTIRVCSMCMSIALCQPGVESWPLFGLLREIRLNFLRPFSFALPQWNLGALFDFCAGQRINFMNFPIFFRFLFKKLRALESQEGPTIHSDGLFFCFRDRRFFDSLKFSACMINWLANTHIK